MTSSFSPEIPALPRVRRRCRLKTWAGRAVSVVFGLIMAWLIAEVLLRLLFFWLPPRLQLVLRDVYRTPFSASKLLPDPIWQPDSDYLTIARPVRDYEQSGSAEVRFRVTTETLWGSRLAFRTRQALVDRYVDGVAVGDSFTFCFTEEDECWVQRLGALTGRNIINLGIVSTGSLSHQRVLDDFGMPLKPPLVIWQWYGNDANEDYGLAALRGETDIQSLNPAPAGRTITWWDQYSAVYVLLRLIFGPEDEFEGSLQFLDREFVTEGDLRLGFGRPYLWGAFDMDQPTNTYGWERSQAAFLAARDQVQSYGGTLVFVLVPTKEQVYRHLAEPRLGADKLALLDASYTLMLDFCAAEGLTCLDLQPLLAGQARAGEQLYYTTDIHLNARGNEIVAEALASWLDQHPEVFPRTP